ncbi:MAG TPA: GAF domain-containing protein [Mycobacteriales bacterium]|nr:GAF domain-containing protein [Mycobacteriales bacterium]
MVEPDNLHTKLASLHEISVEIAALRNLSQVHERALNYCRELTDSEFAFSGLLRETTVGRVANGRMEVGDRVMDVAAISGFQPSPEFYAQFHVMSLRSSVVGVVIRENRSYNSNDVAADPHSVGQPEGHPPIRKFLGVPLRLSEDAIGMIGVANKPNGYDGNDEQLLSTFANQVAVAVDNARLYERQRQTIAELEMLRDRLTEAERIQLLGRERTRIAGALHDRIEQQIFTIGVRLNGLLEVEHIERDVREQLAETRRIAIQTADEVRRAIFTLADADHGDVELADDVRTMLRDVERTTGLQAHLSVSGRPTEAVDQVRDLVGQIVNEALANIEKHARAERILVRLRYQQDRVDLVIQDDGVGASELVLKTFPESHLHFGLRHIRELVIERGGVFEAANGEEAGFVIRTSIPFDRDEP